MKALSAIISSDQSCTTFLAIERGKFILLPHSKL